MPYGQKAIPVSWEWEEWVHFSLFLRNVLQTIIQYKIRPDVKMEEAETGCVLFSLVDQKVFTLSPKFAPLGEFLQSAWRTESDVLETSHPTDAYYVLLKLQQANMLDARAMCDEQVLFAMSPAPPEAAFKTRTTPGKTYRLDRFAYLRRDGDGLLLESPLTPCRVAVHDADLAIVIHKLCAGFAMDGASAPAALFVRVLLSLGIIGKTDVIEENDNPLAFWEFHDLLFYARTLHGRSMYQIGGTYRFYCPPPSLLRPPVSADVVDLPEPTPALREQLARPFAAVLDERASRREITETPLTIAEVGAFLFAAARIKTLRCDPAHDKDEVSLRPSPSGGARHALEIYPFIRRCEDIPPGAYHYDPQAHRLERIAASGKGFEYLLKENPYAQIGAAIPQITLYISARIGRVAWKYEAIAYKIIHQDLGCLYQTFYLTGTVLGLFPCALGSVDTALLGETLKIDWRAEPFIGAFTLGK
jgi:SagB-type dehydrogenase family enzyme